MESLFPCRNITICVWTINTLYWNYNMLLDIHLFSFRNYFIVSISECSNLLLFSLVFYFYLFRTHNEWSLFIHLLFLVLSYSIIILIIVSSVILILLPSAMLFLLFHLLYSFVFIPLSFLHFYLIHL